MRSVRYAVVAIVPIVLVAPWLYGAMHAMGFLVLSFAPIPLFASYGLLTAMMIAMALAATLLVLPLLLLLVTPARGAEVAAPESPEPVVVRA